MQRFSENDQVVLPTTELILKIIHAFTDEQVKR